MFEDEKGAVIKEIETRLDVATLGGILARSREPIERIQQDGLITWRIDGVLLDTQIPICYIDALPLGSCVSVRFYEIKSGAKNDGYLDILGRTVARIIKSIRDAEAQLEVQSSLALAQPAAILPSVVPDALTLPISEAGGPSRLEGVVSKLYKRIKLNCEVETATRLIRQALDYLSQNGVLLVPDGEDSIFHTAAFRIMLPEPKDVGAVSVWKPKMWEPCVVDFYQFFDDAENTICTVYTVLRNVLDYYVLDIQDTSAALGDGLGESGKTLDDIKNGIAKILSEIQQQRIEQGRMQSILDAVRRFLQAVEKNGLPADAETTKRLDEIYRAINSDLSFRQKLELSLPIIPSLLEYKAEIGAGVDISAAVEELKERLKKDQNKR